MTAEIVHHPSAPRICTDCGCRIYIFPTGRHDTWETTRAAYRHATHVDFPDPICAYCVIKRVTDLPEWFSRPVVSTP